MGGNVKPAAVQLYDDFDEDCHEFIEYFKAHYAVKLEMWVAYFRNLDLANQETTGVAEGFHSLMKALLATDMSRMHTRRIDWLIYQLTERIFPHYQDGARRKVAGIEKNRVAEDIAAASIVKARDLPDDCVLPADGTAMTRIRSCSKPGVLYQVSEDSCTCTHAARGNFCKHVAKLLLQRYTINAGQLKAVMGTKLGTSAGGLAVLRRHYPLRQNVAEPDSSTAAAIEAMPATSVASAQALASAAAAAAAAPAVAAQHADTATAEPSSSQCNAQAVFARALARVQQVASSADLMLAAAPQLDQVAMYVQQLAARTASDAAAGCAHPASQAEPLAPLNPQDGYSLKRHEAACFGGRAGSKRRKQQQPSAAHQPLSAAVEPFDKPARKASVKRGPLIQRLPGYQSKVQGTASGSPTAQTVASATQDRITGQPAAPAAHGCVQLQPAAPTDRLPALDACSASAAATRAPLLEVSQANTVAAGGQTLELVPAQAHAAPALLPASSAMPHMSENLPPMGWPVVAWPSAMAAGQPPPLMLMQYMAALLAQQQPSQQVGNSHP